MDVKLYKSLARFNKDYIFLTSNTCYIANPSEPGHERTYECVYEHVHGIGANMHGMKSLN